MLCILFNFCSILVSDVELASVIATPLKSADEVLKPTPFGRWVIKQLFLYRWCQLNYHCPKNQNIAFV